MITRAQLVQIDPAAAVSHLNLDAICSALSDAFDNPANGFTNVNRKAAFIGQICVESAHFHSLVENLNYGAEGLLRTFPSHFDVNSAAVCAHNPEAIANHAYANRMGNGDVNSGDGWKYRGRGLLQLTGKDNYTHCSIGVDLLANPDYLATEKGAVDSAIWFYTVAHHSLHDFADVENIQGITKVVNGGLMGLADRMNFFQKAKTVWGS